MIRSILRAESRFLAGLVLSIAFIIVLIMLLGWERNQDHFGALSLDGNRDWYCNLCGRRIPEIQDQDLFYHGIGGSIDAARQADILILGSSLVVYAFDPAVLRQELTNRSGMTAYNMGFIGLASGEFSAEIIKHWQLRPKLLVINALPSFFAPNLMMYFHDLAWPIPATTYSRMQGYVEVARRNLTWRFEAILQRLVPGAIKPDRPELLINTPIYRNVRDGSFSPAPDSSRYFRPDNATFRPTAASCAITDEMIAQARHFRRQLGDIPILLTSVPTANSYCPEQLQAYAAALDAEFIQPIRSQYTSADSGGHLDQAGARQFTADFVASLLMTQVYRFVREAPVPH